MGSPAVRQCPTTYDRPSITQHNEHKESQGKLSGALERIRCARHATLRFLLACARSCQVLPCSADLLVRHTWPRYQVVLTSRCYVWNGLVFKLSYHYISYQLVMSMSPLVNLCTKMSKKE